MQVQFNFRHMESSNALRDYAETRLQKIDKYFADPLRATCTFMVEGKGKHTSQFEVVLRNGLQLHSHETTEDMYSSVDLALAKMERQVRRYKDRIRDHKPHDGTSARVKLAVLASETHDDVELTAVEAAATATDGPAILREVEFHAERLSPREAIMQLELAHRAFLVFTNAATDTMCVVYRRADNTFGLIDTHAK